jgi:hypothetical protein
MTRGGKGLRRESEPRTEAEMVFPTICAVAAASGCGSELVAVAVVGRGWCRRGAGVRLPWQTFTYCSADRFFHPPIH